MRNLLIWILVIGFVAYIIYAIKHKQAVEYDKDIGVLSTQPQPQIQNNSNIQSQNGMKIETVQEGTGAEIKNGQIAVVDYVGKLTNGTVFDASARHGKNFEFPLGAGMVIKGWDQGVLGMKVGEKRILTIPPELGYGATGAGDVIPPNATLVFEVTLMGIK